MSDCAGGQVFRREGLPGPASDADNHLDRTDPSLAGARPLHATWVWEHRPSHNRGL